MKIEIERLKGIRYNNSVNVTFIIYHYKMIISKR